MASRKQLEQEKRRLEGILKQQRDRNSFLKEQLKAGGKLSPKREFERMFDFSGKLKNQPAPRKRPQRLYRRTKSKGVYA